MQQGFEFFFAAWPLVVVAVLAFVMIRASRGPRKPRVRANTEFETGAWARSEWSAGRRDAADHGGGGDGGGSGGGGGD